MPGHLLSQFPQDEQEDFAAVCTRYGRKVHEFDVVDDVQYPSGGQVGLIARLVRVTSRARSAVAEYDGGHGSNWIADFERDLEAGSFD
ncbi:hypothetical protein [Paraburkholderia youngii]|uniref:hypothetical protein n=1 Tax=Paraburkholderia youngii TaxID=2782701 RepID=UPI003D2566E4